MNFKAYDLPHQFPVAEQLTHAEASRFDDQGFFVIPQDARLCDYPDEIRREDLSVHGEAMRQIKRARQVDRVEVGSIRPAPENKPDYKAIARASMQRRIDNRNHAGGAA